MDPEKFWEEVKKLNSNRLSQYIDYVAYLNSEDGKLEDFLKTDEMIEVFPSEAEIVSYHNEKNLKFSINERISDAEKAIYRLQHKKCLPFLGDTQILGMNYVIVAENGGICKVPESMTGARFKKRED